MKRFLLPALLPILVFAALFTASCSDAKAQKSAAPASVAHEHVWSEYVVIKEPTCTENGEKVKTCACGATVSVVTDHTGHALEKGLPCSERKCLNEGCDYVEPAAEHTFSVKETVPPTCTEKGYSVYACGCGEEYVGDEKEAAGHSLGEWETVTEAACLTDGERLRVCTACGYEENKIVPAFGHVYESRVTYATCTEKGYTEHVCSICSDSYIDSYTKPLWHIFDNDFACTDRHCLREGCDRVQFATADHDYAATVIAPTCTEGGYTIRRCACGEEKRVGITPPAEHSFITKEYEATCTQCACSESVCSKCGKIVQTETAPALGHLYENDYTCCDKVCTRAGCGYVEKAVSSHIYEDFILPSTCSETGIKSVICAVCGLISSEEPLPLAEHVFHGSTVEATCTEKGYTEFICDECGYSYRDFYTEALGHLYPEGSACTDRQCLREGCNHVESASEAHDFVAVTVPSTCEESGYTEYVCSFCGESYRELYTAPLGHLYENDYACCDKLCTREGCGHVEAASAQHIIKVTSSVAATCTEGGHTEAVCEICQTAFSYDTEPAEHDFIGGLCTRCDAIDYDYRCGDFVYELYYYNYEVSSFAAADDDTRIIIVPDDYYGIPVTSIAEFAFANQWQTECLVVGAKVTQLYPYSLYGLTALRILVVSQYCVLDYCYIDPSITVIRY